MPADTALQISGAGPTGRRWARALTARGYPVRRFIDIVPRRWGRLIHGIPVGAPAVADRSAGFLLAAARLPRGTRAHRELAAHERAAALG